MKRLLGIIVFLLLGFVAVGCGSTPTSSATPGSQDNKTPDSEKKDAAAEGAASSLRRQENDTPLLQAARSGFLRTHGPVRSRPFEHCRPNVPRRVTSTATAFVPTPRRSRSASTVAATSSATTANTVGPHEL